MAQLSYHARWKRRYAINAAASIQQTSASTVAFVDSATNMHKRRKVKNLLRLLRLFAAMKSVNQNENSRILRGLHHALKLLILRIRHFELGLHARHRLQKAQRQAALDRVIHVLRQRSARASVSKGRDILPECPFVVVHGRRSAPSLPHTDLKIARIIRRAGRSSTSHQRVPPWWPCASTLGANPCNPWVTLLLLHLLSPSRSLLTRVPARAPCRRTSRSCRPPKHARNPGRCNSAAAGNA
jgi:hypothetical protein